MMLGLFRLCMAILFLVSLFILTNAKNLNGFEVFGYSCFFAVGAFFYAYLRLKK